MAGLITPSPALGCYFDPPHLLLLHICGLAAGSQIKLYLERVITPFYLCWHVADGGRNIAFLCIDSSDILNVVFILQCYT